MKHIKKIFIVKFCSMDYLVGFILGYFVKETFAFLKKLSEWDWQNRLVYDENIFMPLTEDDLP